MALAYHSEMMSTTLQYSSTPFSIGCTPMFSVCWVTVYLLHIPCINPDTHHLCSYLHCIRYALVQMRFSPNFRQHFHREHYHKPLDVSKMVWTYLWSRPHANTPNERNPLIDPLQVARGMLCGPGSFSENVGDITGCWGYVNPHGFVWK